MADKNKTPTTAEELRAAILARYETLSKRLQQIARYVLDEPNAVALETLAVLAERTGVQPSAIVRFAKSFGFDSPEWNTLIEGVDCVLDEVVWAAVSPRTTDPALRRAVEGEAHAKLPPLNVPPVPDSHQPSTR